MLCRLSAGTAIIAVTSKMHWSFVKLLYLFIGNLMTDIRKQRH